MNEDLFDGVTLRIEVPAHLDGVRADRAVSLLTGRSRAEVSRVIEAGGVLLDGEVLTKPSAALREGQLLVANVGEPDDGEVVADASVPLNVVDETADFVVVDKSPDVVVHPGAGQRDGTLVAGLLARYPELADLVERGVCPPERPGIVHRLDRGTSGLLVVARSERGYLSLRRQLDERTASRGYVGLVEGTLRENRGVVDAPIGRSVRNPTSMAVRPDGRFARTHYEVTERFEVPRPTTLLALTLETGRTHQIRVHLASIGHPIVNDDRYGQRVDARLAKGRPFLHAQTLAFDDPGDGSRRSYRSDLPEDLLAVLADSGVSESS